MDKLRNGRFTSSENVALMAKGTAKGSIGVGFYTYVEEVVYEIKLGRALDNESNAKPLSWGNLVEKLCFEELDATYQLVSKDSIIHHDEEFKDWWSGTPDVFKNKHTVGDVKCPMTLKSFCQLIDPLYNGFKGIDAMNAIRSGWTDKNGNNRPKHKDGDKFYWQLVSNSILTKMPFAELIVYAPYEEQYETIQNMANNFDGDQNKVAWLGWANENDLPLLIPGIYYKNVNVIRFEVPESDKKAMEERMRLAIKEAKSRLYIDTTKSEQKQIAEVPVKGANDLDI